MKPYYAQMRPSAVQGPTRRHQYGAHSSQHLLQLLVLGVASDKRAVLRQRLHHQAEMVRGCGQMGGSMSKPQD